jgi:hypothetical protein
LSISRAYAIDVVNLLLASDNLSLRGVDAAAIGDCSRSAYAQHVANIGRAQTCARVLIANVTTKLGILDCTCVEHMHSLRLADRYRRFHTSGLR